MSVGTQWQSTIGRLTRDGLKRFLVLWDALNRSSLCDDVDD